MAALEKVCPACGSQDVTFLDKRKVYLCQDCEHRFKLEKESKSLRIFLSYGHDEHAVLAQQLKDDFQKHHHEVWFDIERLKPGGDWETYIEEGLEWTASESETGRVVLLMTPHSVRRPDGFCHNEIARAISRGLKFVPIMVVWCEPPLSICRIH
ncbi:MAG: toll/interleukin-1 receptor domain-containing protein [Candidatus Xenobiia bacterium LiM19]